MNDKLKKALVEAFKEVGRVVLMAVVPVAITQLESGRVDATVLYTVAIVTLLRFIDKALHEYGKETGDKELSRGLTQF